MMTPRLQDSHPTQARTLVLGCTEASALDPTWRGMLRRHALVLRTQGDGASTDSSSLQAALRAHPIERVIVLGHLGCHRAEGRVELAQNTAAVAAFCRYVGAACTLVKRRARGELSQAQAAEKLDVLVRLANVEACAELHAAMHRGGISVHAAVYDPATREVELFDGAAFQRVDGSDLRRLITGARQHAASHDDGFAGTFAVLAASAPVHGAQPGGLL